MARRSSSRGLPRPGATRKRRAEDRESNHRGARCSRTRSLPLARLGSSDELAGLGVGHGPPRCSPQRSRTRRRWSSSRGYPSRPRLRTPTTRATTDGAATRSGGASAAMRYCRWIRQCPRRQGSAARGAGRRPDEESPGDRPARSAAARGRARTCPPRRRLTPASRPRSRHDSRAGSSSGAARARSGGATARTRPGAKPESDEWRGRTRNGVVVVHHRDPCGRGSDEGSERR